MKDATLCYIEQDGKYLMMLRNKKRSDPNEGKWIGVGGKLEAGETPMECARREIREETGLVATEMIHFGDVYFYSDVWEEEIMRLFLVKRFEGRLTRCDEGELHWIDKSEIFDLNLWDGDRIFLQYLINGRRFDEMRLSYKGDRLCGCSVDGSEQELIDVYNRDGSPAGYVASRDFVHWKGLWHSTAHVWLTCRNEQGKPMLLLQLRAAGKRLYPSHWDTSAAGHIPAGEDVLNAAVREIGEELGIHPSAGELTCVGMIPVTYDDDDGEGYHDREFCHIYLLRTQPRLSGLTLQASEVERVMWMDFDGVAQAVKNNSLRHCLHMDELALIRPLL